MKVKDLCLMETVLPCLKRLPNEVYFDLCAESRKVSLQADSLEMVEAIKKAFPSTVWKRTWDKRNKWWVFDAGLTLEGERVKLHIYACEETPASCTPIYETRKKKKKVPVEWKEQEVVEKELVGFNCGFNCSNGVEEENDKEAENS